MNGSSHTEKTKVCEFNPNHENAGSFGVVVSAICANSGLEYWPTREAKNPAKKTEEKTVVYVRRGQGTPVLKGDVNYVAEAIKLINTQYKDLSLS